MIDSSFELYGRGEIGKLALHWHGVEANGANLLPQIALSLNQIEKLVVVVDSDPHTLATCLRAIFLLTKELQAKKVESQVVFTNAQYLDVAQVTGFDQFFQVWPDEKSAALAMGIASLYPLTLIKAISTPPEPIAA